MRRESRNYNAEEKIKWGKLISFLIAIVLLGIAIAISMTQEKKVAEVDYSNLKNSEGNTNLLDVEETSSDLTRNINQVLEENIIKENLVANENSIKEKVNEIEPIKSIIPTSTNETVEENKVVESNTNETPKENENKEDEEKVKTEFIFPVEGKVIKEFAKDNLIYSETLEEWITHTGIDIKAEKASVVKAVSSGTIKSIKNDPRYGLTVTIEHSNGYVSSYSSLLTSEFVKEGEKVEQGQTIGTVGNSAVFEVAEDNHLHFELLKDGSNVNPEIYLK